MANLTKAHTELFRRTPDQYVESLQALHEKTAKDKADSRDRWQLPQTLKPHAGLGTLGLHLGDDGAFLMNDWSFTQLCKMAGVAKDTINRLSPETAAKALEETLPIARKPSQILTLGDTVRSIHGTNYARLYNCDLVSMLREFAVGFTPPQKAMNGGTGLYLGERDMFVFMIDPTSWVEIENEAFCPGFMTWNSEVGCRTVGMTTFWLQKVCANHIIWEATEIVEYVQKHTSKVEDALPRMRQMIETIQSKKDERKDSFARVMKKAMRQKLGDDADEALKNLIKNGIPQGVGKQALELAQQQGRFTVFSLVDALTRLARDLTNAGDRTEADERAAKLLSLVKV